MRENILKIFLFSLSIILIIACSGGGGSSTTVGGSGLVTEPKVPPITVDSQLTDDSNWQVFATFDQKDTSGSPTYSKFLYDKIRVVRKSKYPWIDALASLIIPQASAYRTGNRIYTASGLVSERLEHLYADENIIAVGNLTEGFSHIAWSDISDPKGKVCNYRGRDNTNAISRFGLSGFARSTTNQRVYAWYGRDIVDVIDKTIVFTYAPNYTGSIFGCLPKNRFVSDESGNFWIGTSNLEQNGDPIIGLRNNGLYRIASDFSAINNIFEGLPIWSIFKDEAGVIWIGTQNGIYRREQGGMPQLVYDSVDTEYYPEQILEFQGKIYALMKNFFHNPQTVIGDRTFDLYRWDNNSSQFAKICGIDAGLYIGEMNAFVFEDILKVFDSGNAIPLIYDPEAELFSRASQPVLNLGYLRHVTVGGAIVSVGGNYFGISVYNLDNSSDTIRLTPTNTAEGLIVDSTHSLYMDRDKRIFIGPEASAFNIYDHGQFQIYDIYDEVTATGFFEHQGATYVAGATNLYSLVNSELSTYMRFPNNGERIFYDRGYLWAFPNWGSGYGGIAVLNMETQTIKGTKGYSGIDYWDTAESWKFDRGYHFYDVVAVPHDDSVFIAVGEENDNGAMPYVLRYNYSIGNFIRSNLPNSNSEGIRAFATDGQVIYGASRQLLYIYQNDLWQPFCTLQIGNDIRGMKIANKHLFIISGWNSTGAGKGEGLEVVDLKSKSSSFYDSSDISIPADAIFALEIQHYNDNSYILWLGGPNGVASCNLVIDD